MVDGPVGHDVIRIWRRVFTMTQLISLQELAKSLAANALPADVDAEALLEDPDDRVLQALAVALQADLRATSREQLD